MPDYTYDENTETLTLNPSITTLEPLKEFLKWRDSIVNVRFDKGDWCGKDEIIKEILQAVCCGNIALKSCELPDRLTKIGSDAFEHCTSLKSIIIPKTVTEIGDCAFWGCDSLKSITLPDSVTEIGWEAFFGCESLTKITFCGEVESIGNVIFDKCPKLQKIEVCSKGMEEKMRECVKSAKNVRIKVVSQKDGQNGCPLRTLLDFGRVLHIGRNKGR